LGYDKADDANSSSHVAGLPRVQQQIGAVNERRAEGPGYLPFIPLRSMFPTLTSVPPAYGGTPRRLARIFFPEKFLPSRHGDCCSQGADFYPTRWSIVGVPSPFRPRLNASTRRLMTLKFILNFFETTSSTSA